MEKDLKTKFEKSFDFHFIVMIAIKCDIILPE